MDFKLLVGQISALYKKLNKKQKITIAVSMALIVGFITYLLVASFSNRSVLNSNYGILFEGVKPSDSALIIQHLQQNKIPYEIPKEDTILIPKNRIYEERIALASQGIPKDSTVGFEIFDNKDFGATDFESQVKLIRATEGELARTIESLTPIASAKVLIAVPKESVFASQQELPSASVTLDIKPAMSLSATQIMGIKNLVAASIARLTPENVKIVNENGEPLGEENSVNSSKERANMQLRYKQNFEKILEQKIINILSPVVGGSDKVVARVNVDFDFSEKQSTKETFDPNNVVRSEQNLEEKREGSTPNDTIGGVPGVVSNIGPVQGLNKTLEKSQKTQNTVNYEVGKTISQIKGEFGTLSRLSAAVVVDGKYKMQDKDGKEEMVYVPIPKQEMDTIAALVKQTIGFNAKRGDEVSVSNLEFNSKSESYKPQDTMEKITSVAERIITPIAPVLKYLIIAVVLIYFYKKIIAPFAERMLEVNEAEDEKIDSLFDSGEEEEYEDKLTDIKKRIEEQFSDSSKVSEDEVRYDILLNRVRDIVMEKPEEIAQLFETLIHEELTN